ncbi:MAG: hypothetical protein ACK56I_29760, partial [bacterium]
QQGARGPTDVARRGRGRGVPADPAARRGERDGRTRGGEAAARRAGQPRSTVDRPNEGRREDGVLLDDRVSGEGRDRRHSPRDRELRGLGRRRRGRRRVHGRARQGRLFTGECRDPRGPADEPEARSCRAR